MNNLLATNCPRCAQPIDNARLSAEVVVCNHCGFSPETRAIANQEKYERQYVKGLVLAAILIVASFIHVVEWDQYFFTIIPLKMRQIVGAASNEDLRKIVQICEVRLRHACVEKALAELSVKEPTNSDVMYDLGEILRKTYQTAGAVAAYRAHFARGGNNPEAAFQMAKIMQFNGQYNEAQAFYSRALLARPNVLQITVVQAYVDMLIKLGKTVDAKNVIDDIRKNAGPTAHYFMAKEYDSISQR